MERQTKPIYEITYPIHFNGKQLPIKLNIEYSSNEYGHLEYEATRVVDEKLTPTDKAAVEKALENGQEEDVVRYLYQIYLKLGIPFSPNHYQI